MELYADMKEGAVLNVKSPLLQLKEVDVRRSGRSILQIDNLEILEGESIAVLGPNGAGKTTFVNLLTREVFPLHRDDPPVVFRGNPRMTLQETKLCTGVISSSMQEQIKVHLTAKDVVEGGFFGSLGVPKRKSVTQEQSQLAEEALDELGIASLAGRDILTLSTGQARRVLAARALVHQPDILIFDEPCTGLDPQGMFYVRRMMRELAQGGRTIMLVTHYLEDIVQEISRVILIKDAKVFADEPKEKVLTSEMISTLFDIPATVTESDGRYYLEMQY